MLLNPVFLLDPVIDSNTQIKFLLKENNSVDYYIENCITDFSSNNYFDQQSYVLDSAIVEKKSIWEEQFDHIVKIAELSDEFNIPGAREININVILNAFKLLEFLPPSMLEKLNTDNIYPTKFGTILMDWEIDGNRENAFSLEIAKNTIGYAIEKEGKDVMHIDNIDFSDNAIDSTIAKIIKDFSIVG
ncbi:hypothetical protein [Flavobacterium microcysteis]